MSEAPRLGGWQEAASAVSAKAGKEIKRQQIYMWWARRAKNSFPERKDTVIKGKTRKLLDLDEVLEWYDTYVPNRGGGPRSNPGGGSISERISSFFSGGPSA